MISITNQTPSGDDYPASFGDTITLEKTDETSTDYEFEVGGLRENPFTFWIPKTAAGGSTIDYEAVAYWLMNKVEEAVDGRDPASGAMTITFSLDNVTSGVATLDVDGDYTCVYEDLQSGVFTLRIEGIGANDYGVEVPQGDAGGNSWPDPGDVFRWLMEKLKELVCPNCL